MSERPPRRRSSRGGNRPGPANSEQADANQDGRLAASVDRSRVAQTRTLALIGGALIVALLVTAGLVLLTGSEDDDSVADQPIVTFTPTGQAAMAPSPVPTEPEAPTSTATPTTAITPTPEQTPSPAATGVEVSARSMGDPDAPVRIIEWADYQCPFCALYATQIEPLLRAEYIETGKVHYEYRDLVILGQESLDAAEAAACAGDQGRFWEYHDILFANHAGENRGAFARQRLDAMAEQVGLDMAEFGACFDGDTKIAEIEAMYIEATRSLGIDRTPTFMIDEEIVVGIADYESFKAIIERHLSDASD